MYLVMYTLNGKALYCKAADLEEAAEAKAVLALKGAVDITIILDPFA